MAAPTVDDVAAELIALPLDSFTRERNARAAATADAQLAAGIRTLRKPSLAAWVVALLVRSAPTEIDDAFELGAALREAQDELDAATLTQLTAQRRALVAGLARRATALAADDGVTVSRSVTDDVERTLNAAMRDAAAAAAVRSGRLVRALDVVGFDPVDLDGALAGGLTAAPASAPADDLAERRARKAAERAAREAEQAAAGADRALATAAAATERAREHSDRVHERLDGLRREAERVAQDAAAADAALTTAEEAQRAAARAAADAHRRAQAASAAVTP